MPASFSYISHGLGKHREALGLTEKQYRVMRGPGGNNLDMLSQEARELIRNEDDDRIKRAMIIWASSRDWGRIRRERADSASGAAASSTPADLVDHDELQDLAEKMRQDEKLLPKDVEGLAATGAPLDKALQLQQVLSGFKKHKGTPSEATVRAASENPVIAQELSALMHGLRTRKAGGLVRNAEMSASRQKIIQDNIGALNEPGKGKALAEAIRNYTERGVSLSSPANYSRLDDLMTMTTSQLQALNQMSRVFPRGANNFATRAGDKIAHNMTFSELESTLREGVRNNPVFNVAPKIGYVGQQREGEEYDAFVARWQSAIRSTEQQPGETDTAYAERREAFLRAGQQQEGESDSDYAARKERDGIFVLYIADEDTENRNNAVQGMMSSLSLIRSTPFLRSLKPQDITNLTTKDPAGVGLVFEALKDTGHLDSTTAGALLQRLDDEGTPDCDSIVRCIHAMDKAGIPFHSLDGLRGVGALAIPGSTDYFERVLALGAGGTGQLATLLEATGSELGPNKGAMLLDFVESEPSPRERDVSAISTAIETLVQNGVPLRAVEGAETMLFARGNFLEKMLSMGRLDVNIPSPPPIPQRGQPPHIIPRTTAMKRLMTCMQGADRKLSNKRVEQLLDALDNPDLNNLTELEMQAIESIVTEFNREEVPLTQNNVLKNLLNPNTDERREFLTLLRGVGAGQLHSKKDMEAVTKLYNEVKDVTPPELRAAKMAVLAKSFNMQITDNVSFFGKMRNFFKGLFSDPALRLQDAVSAVKTAEDGPQVLSALDQANGPVITSRTFKDALSQARANPELVRPMTSPGIPSPASTSASPQASSSAPPQASSSAPPQASSSAPPQASTSASPQASTSASPQASSSTSPLTSSSTSEGPSSAAGGGTEVFISRRLMEAALHDGEPGDQPDDHDNSVSAALDARDEAQLTAIMKNPPGHPPTEKTKAGQPSAEPAVVDDKQSARTSLSFGSGGGSSN